MKHPLRFLVLLSLVAGLFCQTNSTPGEVYAALVGASDPAFSAVQPAIGHQLVVWIRTTETGSEPHQVTVQYELPTAQPPGTTTLSRTWLVPLSYFTWLYPECAALLRCAETRTGCELALVSLSGRWHYGLIPLTTDNNRPKILSVSVQWRRTSTAVGATVSQ